MIRFPWRKDYLSLEITSADKSFLRTITEEGIALKDIQNIDALSVRMQCRQEDLQRIESLAAKYGANVKIVKSPIIAAAGIMKRPVMLTAILLFGILVAFLPTRVLFVRVEGNASIPANLILEEAEQCGIRFGAPRRRVRSEKMKNALLGAVPQLQWAGINTSGCVATISVREKTVEEQTAENLGIGSIIADADGVIRTCTVLNGTALCRVGDAVTVGETLVSGYTDCGIAIKAVRAEAEITACTIRSLSAFVPSPSAARGEKTHEEIKYSLRIGKKLINFFKDSGISDTSCVKMYEEEYLTLPGGFQLPVALVSQRYIYYDSSAVWESDWELWLADGCREYLLTQMQAGQILSEDTQIVNENNVCCFYGKYVCLESIGQFVNEEIIKNDG